MALGKRGRGQNILTPIYRWEEPEKCEKGSKLGGFGCTWDNSILIGNWAKIEVQISNSGAAVFLYL